MGYLQDFEGRLRGKLESETAEDVVRFVKAEILASYKNGLRDGRKEREAGSRKYPSTRGRVDGKRRDAAE